MQPLCIFGACHCLQDLKNAKSVVDWIAWAEPQYDFNPIMDEWCKEAPKELDFNIEAGMLWFFGDIYTEEILWIINFTE